MNYILKPSLQHIALVKVAAMLWDLHDVKDLMTKFNISWMNIEEKWFMIEKVIFEKVSQLPLPEFLKKKAFGFMKPIGFEILHWIQHHLDYLDFDALHELHWLQRGIIDRKTTAEVLIKDENIAIDTRYDLACIYCLEESIYELWNKIPLEHKRLYYNVRNSRYFMKNKLVMIWTCEIMGELPKFKDTFRNGFLIENDDENDYSPYQLAFEYAAITGHLAATEHFMQKLESREREESLLRFANLAAKGAHEWDFLHNFKNKHSEVLYVLLSQMDNEQQVEFFEISSCRMLECFLDWPCQIFFMETVDRIWNILPKDVYETLLIIIIDKLKKEYSDFNYQKLFKEMWQRSPDAHKTHIYNGFCLGNLLHTLIWMEDKNNINLIFQETSLTLKNNFIFSLIQEDICYDLIEEEKWGFLGYVIRECLSSKDLALKFRKNVKRQFSKISARGFKIKKEKFLHLLDDFIHEFNKRECLDDDKCDVKRLCSKSSIHLQ